MLIHPNALKEVDRREQSSCITWFIKTESVLNGYIWICGYEILLLECLTSKHNILGESEEPEMETKENIYGVGDGIKLGLLKGRWRPDLANNELFRMKQI